MAMLWGSTFVVTKGMVGRIGSADLTFVRFGLALLVLVAVAPRALRMSRRTLVHGLLLGSVFTVGQLPQTYALEHVDASVAGFYTGLYMVLTPLLAWLILRRRVSSVVWGAVALATAGLVLLSVTIDPATGLQLGTFGWGEFILVLSAVGFAAHIVIAGHLSTPDTAMSLTIVQTAVLVATSLLLSTPDGLQVPAGVSDWSAMLYLAVVCGALSLYLQLWAQSHVEATKASLLMGTEPVWAATLAVAFGGELVTWQMVAGGLAISAAIALVIAPPGRRRGGIGLPVRSALRQPRQLGDAPARR